MTRIRFRVYYGSSSEAGLTMGQVLIPSYLIFTITWLHTRANKGPEKPSILPKVTQPGSPRTYKVPTTSLEHFSIRKILFHEEHEHPLNM